MKEIKIYFAAPLFTQAERIWNRMLKKAIEKIAKAQGLKIRILFPQDIAEKILSDNRYSEEHKKDLLHDDLLFVKVGNADIVMAILDGADSDSGTSGEFIAAKILQKKTIGIRTDFRGSGEDKGLNLMLSRRLNEFIYFPSFNENVEELAGKIVGAIKKIYKNTKN